MTAIYDIAREEMMRNGDISLHTADGLFEAFSLIMQFKERVKFLPWYLLVLQETRKGRMGNFTTTVPFVWKKGDVFSVVRDILETLPQRCRTEEILGPVPVVSAPGCAVRDGYAHLSRAGMFDLLFPAHDIMFEIPCETGGTFRGLMCRSAAKAAVAAGMSAGIVSFSSEREWFGRAFFCDRENRDVFAELLRLDEEMLKIALLERGTEISSIFSKIFPDCDWLETCDAGTVLNLDGRRYLVGKTPEEALTQGFLSCIRSVRDRLYDDGYLDIIR